MSWQLILRFVLCFLKGLLGPDWRTTFAIVPFFLGQALVGGVFG